MKIAFVVHDYNRSGGHSRYVAELASRFARDHDVHVFANGVEAGSDTGITFHHVPAWRATALTSILSFAVTSRFVVRGDFDIVHIQGFCGPPGNVITTHSCNEAWYQGLEKAGHPLSMRDRIFWFITSGLEKQLYRSCIGSQVIACSARVKRDVEKLYGCRAPIHVVYHGVDLKMFSPNNQCSSRNQMRHAWGLTADQTVCLFVGDVRKGLEQCIRALAQVEGVRLVVVSQSQTDCYRELAKELGCLERVRFLGSTREIQTVYAASDVLLLPTPYDTFAMVVSEAMAARLPVIISREAGAAELVVHGSNGFVLSNWEDYEELARWMRRINGDAETAKAMGAAAQRSVEALTWDEAARLTMEVYFAARGEMT